MKSNSSLAVSFDFPKLTISIFLLSVDCDLRRLQLLLVRLEWSPAGDRWGLRVLLFSWEMRQLLLQLHDPPLQADTVQTGGGLFSQLILLLQRWKPEVVFCSTVPRAGGLSGQKGSGEPGGPAGELQRSLDRSSEEVLQQIINLLINHICCSYKDQYIRLNNNIPNFTYKLKTS